MHAFIHVGLLGSIFVSGVHQTEVRSGKNISVIFQQWVLEFQQVCVCVCFFFLSVVKNKNHSVKDVGLYASCKFTKSDYINW